MNEKIDSANLRLAAASLGLVLSGVLMLASCDEADDSKEQPPARVSRNDPEATMPPRLADSPTEMRMLMIPDREPRMSAVEGSLDFLQRSKEANTEEFHEILLENFGENEAAVKLIEASRESGRRDKGGTK